MVAALAVVTWALYLDVAIRNDPISVDFHTYLAAAQVGLQHGWSHIYDQGLVALQQAQIAPTERMQPFISPPTVALVVAPLALFPYDTAYVVWALISFGAFAAAMALCATSPGLSRWIGVVGALAPWWIMHAVNVGQVVPLVAAGTVVGWRLLRDRRDVLAGIAFGALLLKPNTAMLVPLALLFATRYRALAAWAGTAAVVAVMAFAVLGSHGVMTYIDEMRGPWPSGADNVTPPGSTRQRSGSSSSSPSWGRPIGCAIRRAWWSRSRSSARCCSRPTFTGPTCACWPPPGGWSGSSVRRSHGGPCWRSRGSWRAPSFIYRARVRT
ncbi:MAG: DUF2029 domain-containing protein [Chloroflexi bacterium]|nr:MAG: DUF2029 domain-containing protein [Chloroflexota bacterium]